MKFTELGVLLPCHSLEDFPVYHEGAQADELLAAWCALWHPALVAAAGALPTWHRIDVPPESFEGRLLSVPPSCLDRLPAGYVARARQSGAWVIHESQRDAAITAALAGLGADASPVDGELAADFIALGFCRLQVELLTRQMRYSMHIDDTHFQNCAVAAAQAAVAADMTTAREQLGQCFDNLYEARKHFYPVDVYLVDLTLLAETTLGESLDRELATGTPTNLLAPMSLVRQIAGSEQRWEPLRAAIDSGTAYVLGNELEESELPLLPLETTLAHLRAGVMAYQAIIGRPPAVFGRRRAGLTPLLPQLLSKLGYQGALHITLDDGRFPTGSQSKTRWEGLDGSVIDVLTQVPSDAALSATFLGLSRRLADSMDSDHVATLVLAHWPAATSVWYEDLRRIARLSPVLGKFTLLDDYFNHTDMPGRLSKFAPDAYRTPYLKQAIIRRQADPISRFVQIHRQAAARAATEAIATMCCLATGRAAGDNDGNQADSQEALAGLAATLPRQEASPRAHRLLVNTLLSAQRVTVVFDEGSVPAATQKVERTAAQHYAVVDVPPMGFAWVDSSREGFDARAKPIAHENVLTNEFFELSISRETGGIRSLYNFNQRGNQLSQQIALRLSDEAGYTTMRAESVEATILSPALGEIVSRGSLLDAAGRKMAEFRQTTRVVAGSRMIRIELELSELEEPRADPWNSYYAARFAWPDDEAELWRGVGLGRNKTDAGRFEAPEYIDIDCGAGKITILTGGLPYHRRSQDRMLDSLLVVRGESERRFSLALGVDLPQSAAAAQELLSPVMDQLEVGLPAKSASGWFFHVGAKNIVATHWSPLVDDGPADETTPNPIRGMRGFRARLVETAGQPGRVTLRTFRNVATARQVDYLGQTLVELGVAGDKISLDFAVHEWIEIEAIWS